MKDEYAGPFFILLLVLFWLVLILRNWTVWSSDVTKGEVFKIEDATYKCEMVNKLEYKK